MNFVTRNPAPSVTDVMQTDVCTRPMTSKNLAAYRDVARPLHRIADLILIVAAHAMMSPPAGVAGPNEGTAMMVFALVAFTIAAEILGVYRPRQTADLVTESTPVLMAWALTTVALAAFLFASGSQTEISFPAGWSALTAVVIFGWRAGENTLGHALTGWGGKPLRVAILGATPGAEHLCRELGKRTSPRTALVGVFDDRRAERRHVFDSKCTQGGSFQSLLDACRHGEIDVVYVALPMPAEERIRGMLAQLADTTASVFLVANLPSYDLLRARWTSVGSCPLISVHDTPFRGLAAALKRAEDVAGGVVALLLITIPLLVISLLIKLSSRGPVLFRQRRYGLNGAEFRVLKFRTMKVCEDGADIKQAQWHDSRVTSLGRFLRRTSLDELPQFLQVLTGEMSVVGPRPHAVAHNEQYRPLIPGYMLRHKVKPGITGWAQVNGWRGETPSLDLMEKRVQHDLEYIDRWSLLLDLKIVFKTIWGKRTRHNAY